MTTGKYNYQDDSNNSDLDFSNANVVSPSRQRAVSKKASCAAAAANNKRKSTTLPTATVEYLKNWMMSPEHIDYRSSVSN